MITVPTRFAALRALALVLGSLLVAFAARASVVNASFYFGLQPSISTGTILGAVAVRATGAAAGSMALSDGQCPTLVGAGQDCLISDQGWQVLPTVSDDIVGAAGPALDDPAVASYILLTYAADPALNPKVIFDFALFSPYQSLVFSTDWVFTWNGTSYLRDSFRSGLPPWQPTWNQAFAVPEPGTVPLVIAALAVLALARWRRTMS